MVCSPSKNKLSKLAQRASLTIAIKPERGEKNNWTMVSPKIPDVPNGLPIL
jgi:hypothetical protein